jgi:hypothetical protein
MRILQHSSLNRLPLPPRRPPRGRPGRPRTLAAASTFLPLSRRAAAGAGRRQGHAAHRDGGDGASSRMVAVRWGGVEPELCGAWLGRPCGAGQGPGVRFWRRSFLLRLPLTSSLAGGVAPA